MPFTDTPSWGTSLELEAGRAANSPTVGSQEEAAMLPLGSERGSSSSKWTWQQTTFVERLVLQIWLKSTNGLLKRKHTLKKGGCRWCHAKKKGRRWRRAKKRGRC